MSEFSIEASWLGTGTGFEPDRTAAAISIAANGVVVTRAENRWSQSIVEAAPLSAGPLAWWLAREWWRLCFEPLPPSTPAVPWRLAHEIASAGAGFLWPRLRFASDGEAVGVDALPSPPGSTEMLLYLADTQQQVALAAFQSAVDRFVELVIERLGSCEEGEALRALWRSRQAERAAPELSGDRRLEAMLGHDPGETPPGLLAAVRSLGGAEDEIAAICAYSDVRRLRDAIEGATEAGRIDDVRVPAPPPSEAPHQRGYGLARRLRAAIGVSATAPIPMPQLADLLGLTEAALTQSHAHDAAPAAITLRRAGSDVFLFRKRHASARRFEAARLLGDVLSRPNQPLHVAADTKTATQKQQRAFAAEFLAPIEGIRSFWSEHGEDGIGDASEAFEVGERLIATQLVNHGEVRPGRITGW